MKNEKLKGALKKFNAFNEQVQKDTSLEIILSKEAMVLKGGYAPSSGCSNFGCQGYAIACGAY
jgi:hypothetical protein